MPASAASDRLEIVPAGPLRGALAAPPSKSATNRALLIAALAEGSSLVRGPLTSDDTEAMTACLRALGASISPSEGGALLVGGTGGALRGGVTLDARASGTTMRFLAAAAALAGGPVEITGAPGLLRRPIGPLVRALRALGASVDGSEFPPVRASGGGLDGGAATVDARGSSQFASALMMVAPFARDDVTLRIENLGAAGYVEMAAEAMRAFGAVVERATDGTWRIPGGQHYRAREYDVEYDASAAAHLFALAVATGGEVTVTNARAGTLQPDARVLDVFERMGATVARDGDALTVRGPERVRAFDADVSAMPDQLPALAALAVLSGARCTITGAAITRGHETDRISALAKELRALGARVQERDDGLVIEGGELHGATLDPHDDHRLAMAFASLGARVEGVTIANPSCAAKTYPDFWRNAATLGLRARRA